MTREFNVKNSYKETMRTVGASLIVFVVMFNIIAFPLVLLGFLEDFFEPVAYDIVYSVVYDVMYCLMFFVPALTYRLLSKKRGAEPVRLAPKVSFGNVAFIFAAIAVCWSFAQLNFYLVDPITPTVDPFDLFSYSESCSEDYLIILDFIKIGIVPAVCEEFFFRGIILSNLMPYGKTAAVVVSAFFFGAMHGNFGQFLYASAMGLVLGFLYVVTDSIWPSTFVHLINNSLALLQNSLIDRTSEEGALLFNVLLEGVVFTLGAIAFIIFVLKYRKNSNRPRKDKIFGENIGTSDTENKGLSVIFDDICLVKDELPGAVFNPAVIVFLCHSLLYACLALFIL